MASGAVCLSSIRRSTRWCALALAPAPRGAHPHTYLRARRGQAPVSRASIPLHAFSGLALEVRGGEEGGDDSWRARWRRQMPDVAFSKPAPLEGGPFVTVAGGKDSMAREPRVRNPES